MSLIGEFTSELVLPFLFVPIRWLRNYTMCIEFVNLMKALFWIIFTDRYDHHKIVNFYRASCFLLNATNRPCSRSKQQKIVVLCSVLTIT